MNPHIQPSSSLIFLATRIYKNRTLISQLIVREVAARYKGSIVGLAWSFINPVLMLTIYTFVFSVVFKARWGGASESKTEFAMILFSGLIVFNLFAECINRSPNLVIGNANYVKKVVFPLEILPFVALGSALFHWVINLIVWTIFFGVFYGIPHSTFFLLPILMLPLLFITIGLSWIISSVGVYVRDMSQIAAILVSVLMFLSPIFYPVTSLPPDYQQLMLLNPLTIAIEQSRDAMMWGGAPNWNIWIQYQICSIMFFWICFAWFQKMRKGFADVL